MCSPTRKGDLIEDGALVVPPPRLGAETERSDHEDGLRRGGQPGARAAMQGTCMRAERDLGCSEGLPDRVFAEGLEAGDGVQAAGEVAAVT